VPETSLYRRHRPQSFDEVVGQEHIVRTLRNAVERDRVHHAYLFVGTRGTGKTSMAKILARSLNCVNGPTLTPCGECESCRSIAAGTSLDVIEMDAASNRSVDDIRELRDRVGFMPAGGHWKVYILDEAHMLTREAWNAFLKTLEEPPPNTVFVLATTEPHKVMPTIADRCQRFDFQRPSLEQIAFVVGRVAEAEQIRIADEAVAAIARGATGSFRDALATLDQLLAYCGPEIEAQDALAVLGVADTELVLAAADAIANEDGRAALGVTERLVTSGHDVVQFARDLVAHLRQLLVVRAAGEVPPGIALVVVDSKAVAEQATRIADTAIVRSIDVLTAALAEIREGDEPAMAVEVALLRSARPQVDPSRQALAVRLERLESRMGDGGGEPVPARADAPEAGAPDETAKPEHDAGEPEPESPTAAAANVAQAAAATVAQAVDLERIAEMWPAVVDQVRQQGSALLSSIYEVARPVGIDADDSVLKVGFPPSAAFNKRKAEAQPNKERFAEALKTVLGERLRPVYVLLDPSEEETEGEPELSEEELIEQIKSSFGAEEIEESIDREETA
jgi:DNA polymerase-3 subunit gamma/tau